MSFVGHGFADHSPKQLMRNFSAFSKLAETGMLGPFDVSVAKFGEFKKSQSPMTYSDKYDYLFEDKFNLAAIIMNNDEVVYERYNLARSIDASTPLLGMSMSKTAASASIGVLLCQNEILNLNDKAGVYSEFLRTTPYSEVKIRNILQMNSGVSPLGRADEKKFNQKARGMQKYAGEASVREALNFYDVAAREQGTGMNYHSSDTLALSVLIEEISGMPLSQFFYEHIYTQFGQNNYMHWTSDEIGTTVSFSDLVMSARDWINFGSYLMQQKRDNTCLGAFFNEGVALSVETGKNNGAKYGYQSWVFNIHESPAMVLQGHGGQFLVLDEVTDTLLLTISINERYKIGNLFKDIGAITEQLK